MAKRSADKELTHDNWDQEQEEEEAGVFRHASQDVLEKRKIKTAKRSLVSDGNGGTGAFKGFSFGPTTTATGVSGSKPFTFAMQTNSTTGESTTKPALGNFTFAPVTTSTVTSASAAANVAASVAKGGSPKSSSREPTTESQYRRSLRTLNESVVRWVDDHVKANPYCILTPVFSDYEKYIKELDHDFPQSSDKVVDKTPSTNATATGGFSFSLAAVDAGLVSSGTTTANSEGKPSAASTSTTAMTTGFSAPGFSFGAQDSKASTGFSFGTQPTKEATATTVSGFSFGLQPPTEATSAPVSGFNFGPQPTKEATSVPVSGFNFGPQPTKAATSSSASPGASTSAPGEGGDDENYVPPKQEVVDIKEDDAFYTVRCKLYFKIDNEYKERGLGNLYLKPCGDKTQLLVRAGTNLGNILLNIILNKNIPTSCQGNHVTIVCHPNPPLDEKTKKPEDGDPVCMLIRVKKEEDAKTLLKEINDHKV